MFAIAMIMVMMVTMIMMTTTFVKAANEIHSCYQMS